MYLQVIDFKSQDDVNAWVEHARELAQQAWEWQKDWDNTRTQVRNLIEQELKDLFDREDLIIFVDLCRVNSDSAVSSEVNLFRCYIEFHLHELTEEYKRLAHQEICVPCTKRILVDDEIKQSFLDRLHKEVDSIDFLKQPQAA